ncbi:SprT-like domain-containing protein [Mycolicibacterium llatzerense]|uniref:SprT-like domain-containing protein n=1 Tax=Mycolicibacterium llatzerense TaxID=280871 RepID=UPI0008DC8B1D|nr:SprT-like domain-containing protein [Mycolicibacterium llatzerense]
MELIEFETFAQELIDEYLPAKGWRFRFDSAPRRGGLCDTGQRTITMSRRLVPIWTEVENLEALLHEIAHAVGYEEGLVPPGSAPHGIEWRLLARSMGCTGQRFHSCPTLPDPWPGSSDRR